MLLFRIRNYTHIEKNVDVMICLCYIRLAMEEVFFLCLKTDIRDNLHKIITRKSQKKTKFSGGGSRARKNHIGMYRM